MFCVGKTKIKDNRRVKKEEKMQNQCEEWKKVSKNTINTKIKPEEKKKLVIT